MSGGPRRRTHVEETHVNVIRTTDDPHEAKRGAGGFGAVNGHEHPPHPSRSAPDHQHRTGGVPRHGQRGTPEEPSLAAGQTTRAQHDHVDRGLLRAVHDLDGRIAQHDDDLDLGPARPQDRCRARSRPACGRQDVLPELLQALTVARRLGERRHHQHADLGVRWQRQIPQPSRRAPRLVRPIACQQHPHRSHAPLTQ